MERIKDIVINYLPKYWPFLAIVPLFIALVLFFIHIYNLSSHNKKYLRELTSGKNNIRFFTIHYRENFIYVVDKKDFKGKKKQTFKWFYNSFVDEDSVKVKVWINELIKNDYKAQETLEVHTRVGKNKNPLFSLLACTGIDRELGIIHLESHLYSNIKSKRITKEKKLPILTNSELCSYYESLKKEKVNLYLIKLFIIDSNKKFNSLSNKVLMTLIMSRIKKFLNSNMKMCLSENNEVLILERHTRGKTRSINFANKIATEVSKILYLNSMNEGYQYRISIVTRSTGIIFDELTLLARRMTADLKNDDKQFVIYNSQNMENKNSKQIISEKIKYLIKNELFNVEYTTLVNCANGHIGGFYTNLEIKSTLFNSSVEVEEYAFNNGLIHDLLAMLYYKVNSVYINKYFITREKRRLFIDIKIQYYEEVLSIVNSIETPENVKTVFVLKDKDINKEAMTNNKYLIDVLDSLSQNPRIRLGLEFTSTSLEMSDEILKKFNYFIFNFKESFPNLLSSTQEQILIQSLVNTLMEYSSIQLTAVNLTSWQAIEYFSSLGFKYVSGPYFGQENNKLPSIETKKINKLVSLNE